MIHNNHESLLRSEERHKEEVYRTFDRELSSARSVVNSKQRDVKEGAYEDKAAFMVYDGLAGAHRTLFEKEALVTKLHKKPYFAHVEVTDGVTSDLEHFYLSDCESLEKTVNIGDNGYLLPFKQDLRRPISIALFHLYQSHKGDPVRYKGSDREYTLVPKLICDDEVDNRRLIDVVQIFPEPENFQMTADELLEEKLQENRNNPTFKNIIATLQRMQFEIIEADPKTSFVVQGCAGSGKSQCLLHRLFFLRDVLSQAGWKHVLLLTPTQLFRNYSADLIKRYQLSDVANFSVAELYRSLLNFYDERFKNRQYKYELTEEYLPDEYLKEVYDVSEIKRIDSEITNAIKHYVSDACKALGIGIPGKITSAEINEIVKKLEREITDFDVRENTLQQNEEYAEKRKEYDILQKKIDALQKRREKVLIAKREQELKDKETEKFEAALLEAEEERRSWLNKKEAERQDAINELNAIVARWNAENDDYLPSRFAQKLFVVRSIFGKEQLKLDADYEQFLDEYCKQAQIELQTVRENSSAKNNIDVERKTEKDIAKIEELSKEIENLTLKAEEYAAWLREQADVIKGEQSQMSLRRSDMEKGRYYLSRVESVVFEQEVWNVLAPLKEKYHIQTLQIDTLPDGHKKETRILYKSDLLFYLKIYASLHPNTSLPDYRMICVDEGQDLHKADYDMIKRIYPQAILNIFGDTDQVLHTACGISDWRKETGINTIYSLNRNYRNTAAIVEFCNESFGSDMKFVGPIRPTQKPEVITESVRVRELLRKPGITVIVRDQKNLEKLCAQIGMNINDFEFLDTKAESEQGIKIPCYSIFAAKGLEFSRVLVYAKEMTKNQKVVASTRAMEGLYYYEK